MELFLCKGKSTESVFIQQQIEFSQKQLIMWPLVYDLELFRISTHFVIKVII